MIDDSKTMFHVKDLKRWRCVVYFNDGTVLLTARYQNNNFVNSN